MKLYRILFYPVVILIMTLILMMGSAKAQTKDTVITDSTALISISDIQRVAKYLEDKMIAKDFNLVMGALNSVLTEAINERKKKVGAGKPK